VLVKIVCITGATIVAPVITELAVVVVVPVTTVGLVITVVAITPVRAVAPVAVVLGVTIIGIAIVVIPTVALAVALLPLFVLEFATLLLLMLFQVASFIPLAVSLPVSERACTQEKTKPQQNRDHHSSPQRFHCWFHVKPPIGSFLRVPSLLLLAEDVPFPVEATEASEDVSFLDLNEHLSTMAAKKPPLRVVEMSPGVV